MYLYTRSNSIIFIQLHAKGGPRFAATWPALSLVGFSVQGGCQSFPATISHWNFSSLDKIFSSFIRNVLKISARVSFFKRKVWEEKLFDWNLFFISTSGIFCEKNGRKMGARYSRRLFENGLPESCEREKSSGSVNGLRRMSLFTSSKGTIPKQPHISDQQRELLTSSFTHLKNCVSQVGVLLFIG